MKKVIISVKDTVAEVFNDPRVEINTASAIRAFTNSIEDNKNKDDFVMYMLGEFDSINGEITPCDPVKIYSGHDVTMRHPEDAGRPPHKVETVA